MRRLTFRRSALGSPDKTEDDDDEQDQRQDDSDHDSGCFSGAETTWKTQTESGLFTATRGEVHYCPCQPLAGHPPFQCPKPRMTWSRMLDTSILQNMYQNAGLKVPTSVAPYGTNLSTGNDFGRFLAENHVVGME